LKIIFFGSSNFSVPILKALNSSGHEVLSVVTTPPKPKGRGLKVIPSLVQELATELGLDFRCPDKLSDQAFLDWVETQKCDAFVVASYGKFLPTVLLKLPKRLPLNVHPSLLPKYRGASPINYQLLNGDRDAGVSIFKVVKEMDAGDIVAQQRTRIEPDDDALSLGEKLSLLSCDLILEVLNEMDQGEILLMPQDEAEVTFAPKLSKELGFINWSEPAAQIRNKVRGLVPWPTAYVQNDAKSLQILKAKVAEGGSDETQPGQILEISKSGFIRVQTGQGALRVDEVKPAGKRVMTAQEYAIGQRLKAGMPFA